MGNNIRRPIVGLLFFYVILLPFPSAPTCCSRESSGCKRLFAQTIIGSLSSCRRRRSCGAVLRLPSATRVDSDSLFLEAKDLLQAERSTPFATRRIARPRSCAERSSIFADCLREMASSRARGSRSRIGGGLERGCRAEWAQQAEARVPFSSRSPPAHRGSSTRCTRHPDIPITRDGVLVALSALAPASCRSRGDASSRLAPPNKKPWSTTVRVYPAHHCWW